MVLVFLATFGMLCGIVGSILFKSPLQPWLFLTNAVLMTPLPLARRDLLLSALQVVSLTGAVLGLLAVPSWICIAGPMVVATMALVFLHERRVLEETYKRIGAAGVFGLALGYATGNPAVYLIGGVLLVVYTSLAFRRGSRIALLWLILNAIFVVTSAMAVFRKFNG